MPIGPVRLARLAERAGEERPGHVHDDRRHEQQRRPVVHLTHEQATAHLEGQVQRRLVRGRHLGAAQRRVRPLVRDLPHRRVEEEGQERAGEQQDDEREQGDLAQQEGPVVGEDLVQQAAQRGRRLETVVESLADVGRNFS
jgi:hypothetical protein